MPSDLGGEHPLLALAAVATAGAWLLAAAVLYVLRRPPEPAVGRRTLDLGAEPPAVANFLVHDFRVTRDAVPATLLDLAARRLVEIEQRGPGVFYVRLRTDLDEPLTSYDRRVLEHLRRHASGGVVPATALTTGAPEESKRWWRAFTREVVDDAKRRGLSRDRLDARVFTVFGGAALVPAVLAWLLADAYQAGFVVFVAALAVLGWIRARHPQQETPDGLAAASRWLGVRAELTENEAFGTHSPLEVGIWDRLLAYGAALGVAAGAVGPLPMGIESDHDAWSAVTGTWRHVRVRYPRFWPPGFGLDPLGALVRGLAAMAVAAAFLVFFGPIVADVGWNGWGAVIAGVVLAIPCVLVGAGVALAAMAVADLGRPVEVTGQVLRLRRRGSSDDSRYYAAIDDGSTATIRALRVDSAQHARVEQGMTVRADVTRMLRHVRAIAPVAREPGEATRATHPTI